MDSPAAAAAAAGGSRRARRNGGFETMGIVHSAVGVNRDVVARKPAGDVTRAASLLLAASGTAGLVYQLLWVKQLSLVVGADVFAVTTAVSAFFAGLAAGGWLVGRWADRWERPGLLYAGLEAGIALLSVGSTLVLATATGWWARLDSAVGWLAWLVPFALVGLPALLMGGTVPVLIRLVAPTGERVDAAGGRLYAANTAGAILGALATPFALIPWLGVLGSSIAAALLDLLAACGALWLLRARRSRVASAQANPRPAWLPLTLYAVAGGVALGYEVVWAHAIVEWTSTRTFSFAIVLATYLAALTLGSALGARGVARLSDPWGWFGGLIAAAGLVALVEMALLGAWLAPLQVQAATWMFGLTGSEAMAMSARFATAALCMVFVPTLMLGAAFPIALRLGASADHPGRDTGRVLALNTAGGIVGTLLTGFVLVPALGVERALGALALVAAGIGAVAVLRGGKVQSRARRGALAAAAAAMVATLALPPDYLARQLAEARGGELVYHEASAGGSVAVIAQGARRNSFHRLYIQGVSNSGDSLPSIRYMRLQALLPLIIHRGQPRSALVIGLGTGITAGSLLEYPGLETRVCAELLPAVVHAASHFSGNFGAASNPALEIRLADGRRELARSEQRYDLITLEPPPPSAAGVVNLYSRDFYRLAARRLRPGGLFAQWLPLATQTDDDTRSLVRSFLDVFPYATLWTTELHETLLVGSLTPIELDAVSIQRRFAQPAVAAALAEAGVGSAAALVATWVTDRAGLERYAGDALPVTDDRPRIEYGPWVLPDDFPRTLAHVLSVRSEPPLRNADEAFRIRVAAVREGLLSFYEAGLAAYAGDREGWGRSIRRVRATEPDNPYYRWALGPGH
jgi:spermidine synthase